MNFLTKRYSIFGLFIVLFSGCALFGMQLYFSSLDLQKSSAMLVKYQTNEKIISFTKLFIVLILQGKAEVSFDDRLRLENSVRDIADSAILDQWKRFVEAATDARAQDECKALISLLIEKIQS